MICSALPFIRAWHTIENTLHSSAEAAVYDVVGPICETGDFLGKSRSLTIEEGDLLAVRSAGAYGFAMSSNYNSRNRPAEIMVDGDQAHVVRRRETIAEPVLPLKVYWPGIKKAELCCYNFTKMHGLGNDFMVVDMVSQNVRLPPEKIRRLADRHFGVGFDQLLLVESPTNPDMDFRYRIFNADGSEVEQCGNGARCFAKFVRDKKLIGRENIRVQTAGGNIELHVQSNGDVTVDMGQPRLEPAQVPFNAEHQADSYFIKSDGEEYEISAISMGNPHGVLVVDDVKNAPVTTLGAKLEVHDDFPRKM